MAIVLLAMILKLHENDSNQYDNGVGLKTCDYDFDDSSTIAANAAAIAWR